FYSFYVVLLLFPLLLFLPIIRPPPTSTLFPYTTLFRSPPIDTNTPTSPYWGDEKVWQRSSDPRSVAMDSHGRVWVTARTRAAQQDRKSTCLNSSHGSISYAVFCLKKKKKKLHARCNKTSVTSGCYIDQQVQM